MCYALECADEVCAFEILVWVNMDMNGEGGRFVTKGEREDEPSTRVSIGRVARPWS